MKSLMIGAGALRAGLLPGPQALKFGTMAAGFFGEVTAAELATDAEVATAAGLSGMGIVIEAVPTWLKFAYQNKILYVAKKPTRRTLTWAQLNTAGVVKGTKTAKFKGFTFKMRLLTGGNADPATSAAGSEWNALIYPVNAGRPSGDVWANYSEAEMLTGGSAQGSANWCQEVFSGAAPYHVYRGYTTVGYFFHDVSNSNMDNYGWRPVLEYVP